MITLWFVVFAALGTLLRAEVNRRLNGSFPTGTLLINVSGSFALGLLHNASPAVLTAIGGGGLGAFTTFSTFAHHTVELADARRRAATALYVMASVLLAVGAAGAGLAFSS
ncbi:MAG TPA: CrcB family protein [Acidimicrobiales bacterium]|nr:CrcB family protein [Acidimicrobiales bacterium]